MITEIEFRRFCENELNKEIAELDVLRLKTKKNNTTILLTILTLLLLLIIGMFYIDFKTIGIGFYIGVFILLGFAICYPIHLLNKKINYKGTFQTKVIQPIIKFISNDLEYSPEKGILKTEFQKSRIFIRESDSYNSCDLVEGKLDKTTFHFSTIHSEYKTKDSKGNTSYRTIFHGLFFIADFNKSFEGATILTPNKVKGFKFLKKAEGLVRKEKYIELDDTEMNRLFNCYTTDDIKARYILSPSLMQRIKDFKAKHANDDIFMSFVDDHLYLAIRNIGGALSVPPARKPITFDIFKNYFDDIQLVVGVVEDLNLNTRIWSKD